MDPTRLHATGHNDANDLHTVTKYYAADPFYVTFLALHSALSDAFPENKYVAWVHAEMQRADQHERACVLYMFKRDIQNAAVRDGISFSTFVESMRSELRMSCTQRICRLPSFSKLCLEQMIGLLSESGIVQICAKLADVVNLSMETSIMLPSVYTLSHLSPDSQVAGTPSSAIGSFSSDSRPNQ